MLQTARVGPCIIQSQGGRLARPCHLSVPLSSHTPAGHILVACLVMKASVVPNSAARITLSQMSLHM